MRRNGVDPGDVKLATDGVSIFRYSPEDDQILDVLREGQMAFFVELDKITRDVKEDVTLFELDRERFLGFVKDSQDEVSKMGKAVSG